MKVVNMKMKYENMFPDELIEAVNNMPVFFIPTGLLEWHGDHLPLGLDTLKSYEICLKTAERLKGGIVCPPNYFGRPGFSNYVGTLTYSESLIHQLFYEYFQQLMKIGAKVIVLLTGHYGDCQLDVIKKVADVFERENPSVSIIAQAEYEDVLVDGIIPMDHAGMWETSIFLYLQPEKTRMSHLSEKTNKKCLYTNPPHHYYRECDETWQWNNDVMNSSVELGKKAVDAIVDTLVEKIKNKLV